jgi:hypothetical protein
VKYNAFTENNEQEKMKLAEAHAVEVTKLHDNFDLETRGYTEYRQTVHRRLHEHHETVASSFDEVIA